MSQQLDLESLMPADTPGYMMPAWIDCLRWAASDPDMIGQFMADTGATVPKSGSPLDRMIDEATGRNAAIVKAFVEWANVKVWGPMGKDGGE